MKDIVGYEGLYAITSCGRVWSYRRNKFLKPRKTRKGYLCVTLCNDTDRKHRNIHRLVAEAYIPNPDKLDTVDHIDGNIQHNWVNNLQWMSMFDNLDKGKNARIPIRCKETGEEFESIIECSRQLGLNNSSLGLHLKGDKAHSRVGGFHFERIDK